MYLTPIYTINAEEFEGGTKNNLNPIILAYDSSHYESLDTISEKYDTKAIDLVHSVKVGDYTLAKEDIPNIKRISKNTQKNPRERPRSKKWNITTHTNMNARGVLTPTKLKLS